VEAVVVGESDVAESNVFRGVGPRLQKLLCVALGAVSLRMSVVVGEEHWWIALSERGVF
jgi:hypothetical protein